MMTPIDDAAALIGRSQAVALATHVTPDPDAIGTLLGVGMGLRSSGKRVAMLCDDPAPASVAFLPGVDQVLHALPETFQPDLFIGLDASDPQRLGEVAQPLLSGSLPVVNIDHHVTNLNFGAVNLVVPEASSCAEVAVSVLDRLGIVIDAPIASCLMAGIVGDTRGFSTSSVSPETLRTAARLAEAGADLRAISEQVLNRRSLNGLRILGMALNTIHLDDDVVWAALKYADRKAAKLTDFHETGISNLLLSIPEAHVSASFIEQEDGRVEISMRARPGYNVAGVALSLGGGGHPVAAGCTIDGPLDTAIERVVALIKTTAKAV
jgi:phosphoesterase RecJ-like protein